MKIVGKFYDITNMLRFHEQFEHVRRRSAPAEKLGGKVPFARINTGHYTVLNKLPHLLSSVRLYGIGTALWLCSADERRLQFHIMTSVARK